MSQGVLSYIYYNIIEETKEEIMAAETKGKKKQFCLIDYYAFDSG